MLDLREICHILRFEASRFCPVLGPSSRAIFAFARIKYMCWQSTITGSGWESANQPRSAYHPFRCVLLVVDTRREIVQCLKSNNRFDVSPYHRVGMHVGMYVHVTTYIDVRLCVYVWCRRQLDVAEEIEVLVGAILVAAPRWSLSTRTRTRPPSPQAYGWSRCINFMTNWCVQGGGGGRQLRYGHAEQRH